jgi:hypothetical protein
MCHQRSWFLVSSYPRCHFPSLLLLPHSFDTGGVTQQGPLPSPFSSISSLLRHQVSGHRMSLLIQPNGAILSPHCLSTVCCPIIDVPLSSLVAVAILIVLVMLIVILVVVIIVIILNHACHWPAMTSPPVLASSRGWDLSCSFPPCGLIPHASPASHVAQLLATSSRPH